MFVEIIEDMVQYLRRLGSSIFREKNRKPSVHYTFFYLYPGKGVKSRIIRAGKLLIGCKLEMLPLSYSPTIFPHPVGTRDPCVPHIILTMLSN
jgi:hypothetical protein